MEISATKNLTKSINGNIIFGENGTMQIITTPNDTDYASWLSVYNAIRGLNGDRESLFKDFVDKGVISLTPPVSTENAPTPTLTNEEILNRGLTNLINFFREFEFEPNFRFVNTLSFKVQSTLKSAKSFIDNYFALIDNAYKNEISAKIKSKEFDNILKDIQSYGKPNKIVNQRFKVYYGSAGTGKTTKAMAESSNRCIVCNASMLPNDLMEDFVFSGGQPTFQKSVLWECMENGLPIVLDEINLLPFDSLRFLQGILDGKKEFDYKGKKVTIADGFEIIGTMNLSIGGMVYGLPEPLVDRCSNMEKFSLSAEQLANAII